MSFKFFCLLFFSLNFFLSSSQGEYYSSVTIPEKLVNQANAVVRQNDVVVSLNSPLEMVVQLKRVITVLNKGGNKDIQAYVHYDNNTKIKKINALIFNAKGEEIKKIKKNDFVDLSAVQDGTLYSDSRVKLLNYTPTDYPYTVEFTYETITDNTAFIAPFNPITSYYCSAESSSYTLNYSSEITLRKKKINIQNIELEANETNSQLFYKVRNLEALKFEDHSPELHEITPKIMFAPNKFALKGGETEVNTWTEFGKWMYHDLVKEASDLSPETIAFVQDLIKNESSDIAKAKKIYEYVQSKTRYIGVQVGIGGWKPFNASKVDELGYGDCKALTNYTMALLNAVNIESYYTVLYGGKNQRNIDKDFVSMQGNHVFLMLPTKKGDLWLECTSQKVPFGFIAGFTDDRDVLIVTPDGGKIKHTKKYSSIDNLKTTMGTCKLLNNGGLVTKANIVSEGFQYNYKYRIESKPLRDQKLLYKNRWNYINNFTIDKIEIKNDKENAKFHERIDFFTSSYSKVIGDRILFSVNALNRNTYIPEKYKNRKHPLKINRGYKDIDEVEIELPEGYKIESIPENYSIKNQFGSYSIVFLEKADNLILYKRILEITKGEFPKEAYNNYRNFYKDISKKDNLKVVLAKN